MKLREQVKRRYLHRCAAYTPSGTRCVVHAPLEIHHIDGNKSNNDPHNLVPLCRKHHKLFAHALAQEFAEPAPPLLH